MTFKTFEHLINDKLQPSILARYKYNNATMKRFRELRSLYESHKIGLLELLVRLSILDATGTDQYEVIKDLFKGEEQC